MADVPEVMQWAGEALSVGALLPDTAGALWAGAVRRLLVAALVTFPYALYRFAARFEPARPRMHRLALWSTVAVAAAAILMPRYPLPGEARGAVFETFMLVLLAQCTVLSLSASVRLWRVRRGTSGTHRLGGPVGLETVTSDPAPGAGPEEPPHRRARLASLPEPAE